MTYVISTPEGEIEVYSKVLDYTILAEDWKVIKKVDGWFAATVMQDGYEVDVLVLERDVESVKNTVKNKLGILPFKVMEVPERYYEFKKYMYGTQTDNKKWGDIIVLPEKHYRDPKIKWPTDITRVISVKDLDR